MSDRDKRVNEIALAIEARGFLFFRDLLDLGRMAYDAGLVAEKDVWVVTRDYETSAGGDDSEDIGLFWSKAGADRFRDEYLAANRYELPERVTVYRAQVKP